MRTVSQHAVIARIDDTITAVVEHVMITVTLPLPVAARVPSSLMAKVCRRSTCDMPKRGKVPS